jgi:hypothetical protein
MVDLYSPVFESLILAEMSGIAIPGSVVSRQFGRIRGGNFDKIDILFAEKPAGGVGSRPES